MIKDANDDSTSFDIDKLHDYMETMEEYSQRKALLSKHKQYISLMIEEIAKENFYDPTIIKHDDKKHDDKDDKKHDDKDDKKHDDKKRKGLTLYDALKHVSSNVKNKNALASESTAALLNSAHEEINYPFTVREVISMTQKAFGSGEYEETINKFREYNRMGELSLCK